MIKVSAFANFTAHIHPELNISLEERELFSFLSSHTIPDKHEPSFLRCEIAYVIISIMSFNRLWIGKLRFVICYYICALGRNFVCYFFLSPRCWFFLLCPFLNHPCEHYRFASSLCTDWWCALKTEPPTLHYTC